MLWQLGRCGWVMGERYGWLNQDIEPFWKQNNGSCRVRKSNNG